MPRFVDLASLPENVARYAQGQVAAGRFASIETRIDRATYRSVK